MNLVLQAKQLSEYLVLPGRVKALLIELGQTFMVSQNDELMMLKVWAPLLNSQDYRQVFFFVG